MLENQLFDSPQVTGPDPTVSRQRNMRLQPELALAVRRADMDMSWLESFIGVKVKPTGSDS